MELNHEVMLYIVEHEPLPATKLAAHFWWSNIALGYWKKALRSWGWITPKGHLVSTEKGREAIKHLSIEEAL